MMQHGIAGPADQSLFAQLTRRIRLAGIKGRGGAANDVLGGILAHAGDIRTTGERFAKKAGSDPGLCISH
jgi:hypothetical protein